MPIDTRFYTRAVVVFYPSGFCILTKPLKALGRPRGSTTMLYFPTFFFIYRIGQREAFDLMDQWVDISLSNGTHGVCMHLNLSATT